MKRLLLLLLFFAFTKTMAQTTWTGAGANTNWDNTDNWDTNLIPTATDDVIIPTGFTVTLNVAGNIKSIDLQGNSVFEINANLTFTDFSSFEANTTVNWSIGIMNGNSSSLDNLGTMNLTTAATKTISGDTTINNSGTINILSVGDLNITQGILNNLALGVLDLQEDTGNISWSGGTSHVLNNSGIIKKTTSTGEAQIIVELNNNDGTIQVESGTLSFQNAIGKSLTDGTYNVFSGAVLDWDTDITLLGTVTGTIDGDLNWNSNVNVALATSASLDLSGSGNVNWTSGILRGGGTLTNLSVMNLTTAATKTISEDTTLSNSGTLNITSDGDLNISQGILNNLASGVLDFQEDAGNISWSGGTSHVLNNSGIIKKTTSTGEVQIIVELNNNDGIIQVESGTLSFQNAIGKNLTDGTYNIFSGAVLDWDTNVTLSGNISGMVEGDLNWTNIVEVPTTATINFTGNGNINWESGTLQGGGTLTNLGIMNLTTAATKTITGDTTLDNSGTINIISVGDLNITQGILNNLASGVLDLQEDTGNIFWSGGTSHILNNTGLIKRTNSTGEVQIHIELNNNDGTIQVESGTLSFQNAIGKNLTDGTYNIFSGALLDWDTNVTLSGTLSGTIDGTLNWNSIVNVDLATTATMDFSGSGSFNWAAGILQGGGTLTNLGTMNLTTAATKTISGDATLNNSGIINIASNGDLNITQGILNNQVSGIMDLQVDAGNISWSGGTSHVLNNEGLLRRSTSAGLVQLFIQLNNSGTIEVSSGELEITGSQVFVNEASGIVKGVGIFDLPTVANYTNNGTFAPGLSPGTLNIQGDFSSTSTSVLDIELNGLTPNTEYDVLAITGNNNVFNGTVNVTMGFEGNVNDTFTIATTTGTIVTKNLTSPVIAVFEGKQYTFDITYPGDNSVLLTISDKLDIEPPTVVTQNIIVQLDAFGNASITADQIDNGSFDNCSLQENLIFDLDITDFTCSDLGEKIVSLTVTDEAGNFASANATVTVEDSINPTVIVQNVTVQLDALGNASITTGQIDNGSSDNCSISSLSLDITDFTCSDLGDNTVELTVTDQSGNSASATATVTVEDSIDPIVITQDITIQLDAMGNASIVPADVNDGSSDNCMMGTFSLDITDFTCSDLGDNTVELTVTDQSGNSASATATVTVEDSIDPIVITQDITIQLDAMGNASIVPADVNDGSSDNCMMGTFSLDITDFTCSDLGDNTVELTVTDQSGNSASATAIVTVTDETLPEIICPADFSVDVSGGNYTVPNYFMEGDVTASDNCDNDLDFVQLPTQGTVLGLGMHTITVEVTDDSGNSAMCSFTVTVEDTLSIENIEFSENSIVLFPNPATDKFTIKNNSNFKLVSAEIVDIKGSVVKKIDLRNLISDKTIEIKDYSDGVYFVKITSEVGSMVKRLVVSN